MSTKTWSKTSLAALVARLTVGFVILPHGLQKTVGMFGGHGIEGTLHHFTNDLGIPVVLGGLAIAAEFLGGLGLLTGTLTRLSALGVGITMLVAGTTHRQNGFFMNWFANQAGEGFEYHILAVSLCGIVLLLGSGPWAIDQFLFRKKTSSKLGE